MSQLHELLPRTSGPASSINSTRDALPRGSRRFAADVAGSVLPHSPRHRRCYAVMLSRRCRRSFMTAATPRPGFHCPVTNFRRRRSKRYLSSRAMHAPAPFTVRHLTVRSKARPARPPWPHFFRRGAAQEIWASQSAWVAERAMTPVLSTDVCFPRFVLQRTGTPVCLGSLRAVFPRPGSPQFHAERLALASQPPSRSLFGSDSPALAYL